MTSGSHIFLNRKCLKLSIRRLNQSVVGNRFPAQENVEHELNAFETKQVISVNSSQYYALVSSEW